MTSPCFLFLILSVVSKDYYDLRDGQTSLSTQGVLVPTWLHRGKPPLTNNTDTDFMCARKPLLHSVTRIILILRTLISVIRSFDVFAGA